MSSTLVLAQHLVEIALQRQPSVRQAALEQLPDTNAVQAPQSMRVPLPNALPLPAIRPCVRLDSEQ